MRAISALDMALWDIKGQALGVPIYELLGGAVRKRIRVYATGFAYEGAADLARELLDEGITAMKGGPTIALAGATDGQSIHPMDLDRALKPIREIRDAVGMEMEIANDGHGKWSLPAAIQIARAMEPYQMMWQGDLMPILNPDALLRLQEATSAPVCISERLLTRWQLRHFIENGSARIIMPDLIWTGGISALKKIATIVERYCVPIWPYDARWPINNVLARRRGWHQCPTTTASRRPGRNKMPATCISITLLRSGVMRSICQTGPVWTGTTCAPMPSQATRGSSLTRRPGTRLSGRRYYSP